jgi:phosphopantetheinyl transferase (holo-ACP synthase)
MLGNDVVDLSDPETLGARHPRFDARVFTDEERAALAEARDPERLRWSLWAAKEAAYKCLKKLAPEIAFSPSRFAVRFETERAGRVEFGDVSLRVALFVEGDALHAVATDGVDPERRVRRALVRRAAPGSASWAVRELAREAAAAQLGCDPAELSFSRDGRVPKLHRRGVRAGLDLSLSHHGRYLAAAIEADAS